MVCWKRENYTINAVEHLVKRTTVPFRLILVINEYDTLKSAEIMADIKYRLLTQRPEIPKEWLVLANVENLGLEAALNQGLKYVESEIFISTDNDILCPRMEPCWLTQLLELMNVHGDYAAIALRTHIFVADGNFFHGRTEPVIERSHVGGSLRAMQTNAVRAVGGWQGRPGRGAEEKDICGKLRSVGFKVGYSNRIRCYHMFGKNWGYGDMPAEDHGHTPRLAPSIHTYDRKLNPNTFEPKEVKT
jgi:GT2 family glycosyltransferase